MGWRSKAIVSLALVIFVTTCLWLDTDGATISLGGSVSLGESLTLVVPNAYRRASGEKVLMDVSAATAEGGFPEAVSVLDENGVDRSGSCVVYLRDGLVRMASKGLTITVK